MFSQSSVHADAWDEVDNDSGASIEKQNLCLGFGMYAAVTVGHNLKVN
jgi:hypothetical protein